MISPYNIRVETSVLNLYTEKALQKAELIGKETFDCASPETQIKYLKEYDYNFNKAAQMLIKDKIGDKYPKLSFIVEFF